MPLFMVQYRGLGDREYVRRRVVVEAANIEEAMENAPHISGNVVHLAWSIQEDNNGKV